MSTAPRLRYTAQLPVLTNSLRARRALLELCSEQASLTLCELSDRLDLADPVVRKELAALRATPIPLACKRLRHRPPARLHRRIEDHLSDGQLSGADPSLEPRACAPDLVRPLQRHQPIRQCSDRDSWRHACLLESRAPKRTLFAISEPIRPQRRTRSRPTGSRAFQVGRSDRVAGETVAPLCRPPSGGQGSYTAAR